MSYKIITLDKEEFNLLIEQYPLSKIKEKIDSYDTIICSDKYSMNLLKKINKIDSKTLYTYSIYKSLFINNSSLNHFKLSKKHKICLYLGTLSGYSEFEEVVASVLIDKSSKNKIIKHFEKRYSK